MNEQNASRIAETIILISDISQIHRFEKLSFDTKLKSHVDLQILLHEQTLRSNERFLFNYMKFCWIRFIMIKHAHILQPRYNYDLYCRHAL